MKLRFMTRWAFAVMAGLIIAASTQVDAGIVLTVDDPGVQTSHAAGVTTETFNGISTGDYSTLTTAIGSLSTHGRFAVVRANSYGGANGSGHYFAVGAQSGSADPVTLTLNGPQDYFGMWWSAADSNNVVRLYQSGVLEATFHTADAFHSLGGLYHGNPNSGQDSGEKFAYVNFDGTDGTTFNQIVFSNSGTTSTGFESDNWSVRGASLVPEPPSAIMSGMGLAVSLLTVWRRYRSAKNSRE